MVLLSLPTLKFSIILAYLFPTSFNHFTSHFGLALGLQLGVDTAHYSVFYNKLNDELPNQNDFRSVA
ncbi:hypothetical protein [Heyndrickxia oleronia]|uniref:Uncharacterized protein n=1 Tax=Heyndrickxia oleronia TaxID=38875 RepID=A0AAW6SQ97_9BACI|nr:hypothetical protein [Heyndrickxia oleronia]MDH5160944.1 hypothetical protein [Heyndrickxia oleronia]